MDPLTVVGTLWRHKWAALPVLVLTLTSCAYVYFFAPRTYEATISFALTAPNLPSAAELERTPELAKINGDNPYLRSADSSLLTQVVIAKLSDPAYAAELKESGLEGDYKIAPVASLGMGLVTVSATADSKQVAVKTAQFIGDGFTAKLSEVQRIFGANDRYLYSPILVRGPGPAQELFSNRLRSLIMVGIAGAVLLFGTVSLAQSAAIRRQRLRTTAVPDQAAGAAEGQTATAETTRSGQRPMHTRPGRRASSLREGDPPRSGGVQTTPRDSPAHEISAGGGLSRDQSEVSAMQETSGDKRNPSDFLLK